MKKATWMKKGLSAALAGTMALGLVACGCGSGGDSKGDDSKNVTLKWQQWWAVECPEGDTQIV